MVNHLEPDILECEVTRALGSTAVSKASGCGGIHQSVALNMSANLEDPAVATGLEKVNPHSNSQEGWYQRMC